MAGQPARAWANESQFASDTVDETERVAKERHGVPTPSA